MQTPFQTTFREARDTLVPDPAGPHGPLPPLLLGLTVVTGLVDAFSYLSLGHVFVANMTGNVVFMAFSLAGASGFSVLASVLSLLSFTAGAAAGGVLAQRVTAHRARLLLGATVAQVVLVLAGWVMSRLVDLPAGGGDRWTLILLLGLAMGLQNAVVRRLAVPDLTTTVLTLTITGIAADARFAGGASSRSGRRLLSALAMFLGALAGAALIGHGHADLPLLLGAVALAAVAAGLLPHRRSAAAWTG
ncbi:YoaK family protein [Actinacidiphila sp. ITFR-21]|uniref:YoaK family protein n=1 Tax=Actinacidiphila sp. ITFR-21 TaxID=3075199 RepID=UPI00288A9212|nr:YoaK family protein [Streptomyces sp. ITFR-21]WNI14508.1 YoaK family protein [Streptomyces sp. ITFR-21]